MAIYFKDINQNSLFIISNAEMISKFDKDMFHSIIKKIIVFVDKRSTVYAS